MRGLSRMGFQLGGWKPRTLVRGAGSLERANWILIFNYPFTKLPIYPILRESVDVCTRTRPKFA
jgi:hypothetical protein